MKTVSINNVVTEYENNLINAEHSKVINREDWIEILQKRDRIDNILIENQNLNSKELLVKLFYLDEILRKIFTKQKPQDVQFSCWKNSIKPSTSNWWWTLDQTNGCVREGSSNWVYEFVIAICLVISFGLIIDVSPKFLSGGTDFWGSLAVIIQSVLAALVAGGNFSIAGQRAFNGILKTINTPYLWWKYINLGFALGITILLFLFRSSLPLIAVAYNDYGLEQYHLGRISSAEQSFHRALKLNPDFSETHYNLGLIYEDFRDYEKAKSEYRSALYGKLDAAYNNLGRLFILTGDYASAISILLQGLDLTSDSSVRYDIYKNLGWARLKQGRLEEAKSFLLSAKKIIPEKAAANCLLAQVFMEQKMTEDEISGWHTCLMYSKERNPDEDNWINLARHRLESAGEIK